MSRYPRAARNAAIKCIPCNAPVTETADGEYVCVSCGNAPIQGRNGGPGSATAGADD
jgi:predicted RNA-binding Zn-ribbon protein involved in translation (DUF1610 family)